MSSDMMLLMGASACAACASSSALALLFYVMHKKKKTSSAGSPQGSKGSKGSTAEQTAYSGGKCPAGWEQAVGTLYDSWPKPGTVECNKYSGCRWAGTFKNHDPGPEKGPCKPGAQILDGGAGIKMCRWPEAKVKAWSMAATWEKDPALLGKKLDVLVEGGNGKKVTVNVRDVCANTDCDDCCVKNTGNKKFKLIDLEKNPASQLLGFDYSSSKFDINEVNFPNAKGKRPGTPETGVLPLCYRVVGAADVLT